MIAAHNLDAYRAAPDDPDAGEIRASALGWLTRAGERAAALAATEEAQRAFDAAAELADDPLERADLLERAGGLALAGNRPEAAEDRLRAAYALHEEAGATHDAARVAAALGMPMWNRGKLDEAIELMENAFAVLASDEPDADVATLTAQLARLHYFAGNLDTALERIELALETAETLGLPAVLAGALNTKSLVLQNRPHESHALLREALADAAEAARQLGDPEAAVSIAELFSEWPRSLRTRLFEAELARIRANAAAARGNEAEAADSFALALANARNVAEPIWLAPILFGYGLWLARAGRQDDAEPLLAEARQLFTELKAVRWLAQMEESQHALAPPDRPQPGNSTSTSGLPAIQASRS